MHVLPEKATLVCRVKAAQRSGEEAKQAWWSYCKKRGAPDFDPSHRDEEFLLAFLNELARTLPEACGDSGGALSSGSKAGAKGCGSFSGIGDGWGGSPEGGVWASSPDGSAVDGWCAGWAGGFPGTGVLPPGPLASNCGKGACVSSDGSALAAWDGFTGCSGASLYGTGKGCCGGCDGNFQDSWSGGAWDGAWDGGWDGGWPNATGMTPNGCFEKGMMLGKGMMGKGMAGLAMMKGGIDAFGMKGAALMGKGAADYWTDLQMKQQKPQQKVSQFGIVNGKSEFGVLDAPPAELLNRKRGASAMSMGTRGGGVEMTEEEARKFQESLKKAR